MADTIFVLGAISNPVGRQIHGWWETEWYYTRRTPKPVVDWLLESNVAHSVGWGVLPGRGDVRPDQFCVIAFITVHDPNAALELRMRWNAKHTTFAQMRDRWINKGLLTLAFAKEEPR